MNVWSEKKLKVKKKAIQNNTYRANANTKHKKEIMDTESENNGSSMFSLPSVTQQILSHQKIVISDDNDDNNNNNDDNDNCCVGIEEEEEPLVFLNNKFSEPTTNILVPRSHFSTFSHAIEYNMIDDQKTQSDENDDS